MLYIKKKKRNKKICTSKKQITSAFYFLNGCARVYTCTTCWEMRPQRCSSFPEDRAMLAAMAGGGLVFRLLQVQISWARACSVSILSLTKSHWNIRGLKGVLAAWIRIQTHTHNTRRKCVFTIYTQRSKIAGFQIPWKILDNTKLYTTQLYTGFEVFTC